MHRPHVQVADACVEVAGIVKHSLVGPGNGDVLQKGTEGLYLTDSIDFNYAYTVRMYPHNLHDYGS